MSVREWANRHPIAVTTAAAVVLAGTLAMVALQLRTGPPRGAENPAYFLDLGTGELFVDGMSRSPPIEAPSGAEGVKARLFTCGACSADQWFGYVERYGEHAAAAAEARREIERAVERRHGAARVSPDELQRIEELERIMAQDRMVRPYNDTGAWVPATSAAGARVQSLDDRCGANVRPTPCRPPSE